MGVRRKMWIKWFGMSAFLITSEKGTRIITDPFIADKDIHYSEIKESADVVTISCGHFSHCYVYSVGGEPNIYTGPRTAIIKGIKFRSVSSSHLAMDENKPVGPGINNIISFDVDGIRICHLGALGHKLSKQQAEQIGKVDILFIPVGGYSTLPVAEATKVCSLLKPKIIFPMHYRSERCNFDSWSGVDDFLKNKLNVIRMDSVAGCSELEFEASNMPTNMQIMVLKPVY